MIRGLFQPIAIIAGLLGLGIVLYGGCRDVSNAVRGTAPRWVKCSKCGSDVISEAEHLWVWCDVCHEYVTPKL